MAPMPAGQTPAAPCFNRLNRFTPLSLLSLSRRDRQVLLFLTSGLISCFRQRSCFASFIYANAFASNLRNLNAAAAKRAVRSLRAVLRFIRSARGCGE